MDGIKKSLDLIDSVFLRSDDQEYNLPEPILQTITDFEYQIQDGELISMDYVSYGDIILTPPPPMLDLTPSMMPPLSLLPSAPTASTLLDLTPSMMPPPLLPTATRSVPIPYMVSPAIAGPSTGRVLNNPPPQRNFFVNDSDDSDTQVDHFGLPVRTRSQTSSISSVGSVQNSTGIYPCPPAHKVQCTICSKFYTKSYLKRHVLIHNK